MHLIKKQNKKINNIKVVKNYYKLEKKLKFKK